MAFQTCCGQLVSSYQHKHPPIRNMCRGAKTTPYHQYRHPTIDLDGSGNLWPAPANHQPVSRTCSFMNKLYTQTVSNAIGVRVSQQLPPSKTPLTKKRKHTHTQNMKQTKNGSRNKKFPYYQFRLGRTIDLDGRDPRNGFIQWGEGRVWL